MNGLDWVIIGIGAFCVLRGIFRGAISQAFGIAGVLAGFLVASRYHELLSKQLLQAFPNLGGSQLISLIVLFALTWFCVAVAGFWVARLAHRTGLGFLDRLLGGALGAGKALILAAIIITALTLFLPPKSEILSKSLAAPHVKDGARILVGLVPESLQRSFQEKQKDLDRYIPDLKERALQSAPRVNPEPAQKSDEKKQEVKI